MLRECTFSHKALCQHSAFLNVGGTAKVVGVMPLVDSDTVAKLGIHVNDSSLSSHDIIAKSKEPHLLSDGDIGRHYKNGVRNSNEISTELDIMMYEGEQEGASNHDDAVKSGLDSLCGKILAWFFMWDGSK